MFKIEEILNGIHLPPVIIGFKRMQFLLSTILKQEALLVKNGDL